MPTLLEVLVVEEAVLAAQLPANAEPPGGSHGAASPEAQNLTLDAYERWGDAIYLYALRHLSRRADAEDLTQETFLRFYRIVLAGERLVLPRAWLFTVARNLIRDYLRHRRVRSRHEPEETALNLPATGKSPEERMARIRQFELVHTALRKMPARERECLLLRAHGLRFREIAQAKSMSPSCTAALVTKTIDKLRRVTTR